MRDAVRRGARRDARRRCRGEARTRVADRTSVQPRRVRERGPRPARRRGRRRRAPAERWRRLRLRQHRGGAHDLAIVARALSHGGAARRGHGSRQSRRRADGRFVRDAVRVDAGQAPRRHAARHARRHASSSHVPGGRRVRVVGPAARRVDEGYVGVEGHDAPHEFLILVDGKTVYLRGDRRPGRSTSSASREGFNVAQPSSTSA